MTKKEMFVAINSALNTADLTDEARTEMQTFLTHQVEILDNRKNSKSSKPTGKQLENEGFKNDILEMLAEGSKTCGELAKALGLSSQRCSALLRQLGDKGTKEVVKTFDKKVAYFSLAEYVD
jgi:predicted HTH transcriptional regulator